MDDEGDLSYLEDFDLDSLLDEIKLDVDSQEDLEILSLSAPSSQVNMKPNMRKSLCIRDVIDGVNELNEKRKKEFQSGGIITETTQITFKNLVISKGDNIGDFIIDFTQYQNKFNPNQYQNFIK